MQNFDVTNNVSPGKHLYQFYKNADDYFPTVTAYFHAGLLKGDACLWLVSSWVGLDKARTYAARKIPRFFHYENSGQIRLLPAEPWYLRDGHFDEAQAISKAEAYAQKVFSEGYACLRGSGDAAAIPHEEWPKLESYEEKITGLLKKAPFIALCTYPILECALNETKMVIDHHDDVLVGRV